MRGISGRPLLAIGLGFLLVVVLVIVFIVSIGIGAVTFVTGCGINPLSLLNVPAAATQPSPSSSATNGMSASGSPSPTPSAIQGTLFAAFQNQPQFSLSDQAQQRTDAAIIVAKAQSLNLDKHDAAVAIGASLQESRLLNAKHGDRDSVGVFQQRPSQGWGTVEQIMNVDYAAGQFFAKLVKYPDRDSQSLKQLAIDVQNPNLADYNSGWHWDDLATEIVAIYWSGSNSTSMTNVCAQAAGVFSTTGVALPVDPGFRIAYGGGFDDPHYPGDKPHKGTDLIFGSAAQTLGKPVYAAFNGTVVASGIGNGCKSGAAGNNEVMIETGQGFKVGYMHMNGSQILVHIGDHVTAGERIGSIGECGQATGPHVHFEITPDKVHDAWMDSIPSVLKYGDRWLDPVAFMAHYGIKL